MRLSDKQPKNTKNTFFVCFWAYVGQPHDLISWAVPMPFASINSTIPRTDPWEFHEKILRIGGAGKWGFFEAAILNFLSRPFWIFFLQLHELGVVLVLNLMMSLSSAFGNLRLGLNLRLLQNSVHFSNLEQNICIN